MPDNLHEFDPGFTGLSETCNRLVERDGHGEDCGLRRQHPIHAVTPEAAMDWLIRVHDSDPSHERLMIVARVGVVDSD